MHNVFNRFPRQVLVFVATLVFLGVSTLALTHGHGDSKSVDMANLILPVA